MLKIRGLRKVFGNCHALDGLDMDLSLIHIYLEREIVANVVRYHLQQFKYDEVQVEAKPARNSRLATPDNLTMVIAKLTAILRLANSMDRGHKGKLLNCKIPVSYTHLDVYKRQKVYTEVSYDPDCYIMFGKESAGIPEEILVEHKEDCVRIPMWGDIRSLNLANSVAIVLYEALRQNGFEKMTLGGHLHRLDWKE